MKRLLLIAVFPAFGLACEAILGIEDASVDPALAGESTTGGAAPATGGSAGADVSHGGDSTGGGGAAPDLCAQYCATVMASCTGPFAVYTTAESCLAVCEQLPAGSEGDEIGNSGHCRLRHAESAPAEPLNYCPIAGPGGNGICGGNCESLCTVAQGVCTGDLQPWSGAIACQNDCAGVPDLATYSTDPDAAMYKGDHVQCRLFHLSSAAVKDPEIHCPHVAGAPPCAPEG